MAKHSFKRNNVKNPGETCNEQSGNVDNAATRRIETTLPSSENTSSVFKKLWHPDDEDGTANTNAGGAIAKETVKVTFGIIFTVFRKLLTYALNILLTLLLIIIITGAAAALAFVVYIKNYIDPEYTGLDNLQFDSALSTSLYYVDDDGNEIELEEDRLYASENRLWVSYSEIPEMLVDAYIAVEDQRFLSHNGVDTKRTLSAVYNFFMPTNSAYGGGSTITQQLIKNVSGENQTTIQRKVQEILRALNVEKKFTKTEILEMYLNTIYLSHNCNGVRAAAETYFGKELNELTLVECAAIAGIGKSPVRYDPIINPQNNLTRRNLVLKLMLEQGKITQEEFDEAYDAPLLLKTDDEDTSTDSSTRIRSYYLDAVMDDVIDALMEKYECDNVTASQMLYAGGLQIVTCMDPNIQAILDTVYTEDQYWTTTTGIKGQSAMCVMDQYTGDLLAIRGGRGEKTVNRGLNRATHSKRQCGSSIKPLSVYSLAIEKGLYTYGSSVDDSPVIYYESTDSYWPPNSTNTYMGKVSLSYAIQRSLNTVAVRTCMMLGVDTVYDNLVNNLGFTTLVENVTYEDGSSFSDRQISPLALGSFTYGVTVREMTQAYAMMANGGTFLKARTFSEVRDSKGNVIIDNSPEIRTAYKESTCYIITKLMEKVIMGSYGTSRKVVDFYKSFPGLEVCGKTGSTNDNKDNYYCGYTPDYTVCCWYGYDNNKTIVSTSNPATEVWNSVMRKIYEYHEANNIPYTLKFTVPADVVTDVEYCSISGQKPCDACRADLGVMNGEMKVIYNDGVYTKDTVPTEECTCHIMVNYDSVTKAVSLDGCECPSENIIQVSLRKVDRVLYKNIRVYDSEYLYYPITDDYTPPESTSVSYWRYLLPEGVYMGYSNSSRETAANRVCIEHWVGISHDESSDVTDSSDSSEQSNTEPWE